MHTPSDPQLGFFGVSGIVLVALGGLVIRLAGNGPVGADQPWHDVMAANQWPVAVGVARLLNTYGGTMWMTIITAAIIVVLLILRQFAASMRVGLSVAVAAGVCSLLKLLFARPRPGDATVDFTSDSFPSGHVTSAAALAVGLALLLPRVWTWALAAAWVLLMALSRTYLLVHWTSDVLAAAVLGTSVAALVTAVVNEVSAHLRERSLRVARIPG